VPIEALIVEEQATQEESAASIAVEATLASEEYVARDVTTEQWVSEAPPVTDDAETLDRQIDTSHSHGQIFTEAAENLESSDMRPSRALARELLNRDTTEQVAAIPDLVVQLLRENQNAQAYLLARAYDDARPDDMERIPNWLVRALVLTPY